MFTVRVTFLDEVDEFGYIFKEYDFEDINEARSFYAMKKKDYENNDLVSVSTNC